MSASIIIVIRCFFTALLGWLGYYTYQQGWFIVIPVTLGILAVIYGFTTAVLAVKT